MYLKIEGKFYLFRLSDDEREKNKEFINNKKENQLAIFRTVLYEEYNSLCKKKINQEIMNIYECVLSNFL